MDVNIIIDKLNTAIFVEESEDKIEIYEDLLGCSIEIISENENFFSLPTKNVLNIIKNRNIKDPKLLCKLAQSMSAFKAEDAPLFLNVADTDEGSFDDYVDILASLKSCPICKRISDIIVRNKNLPRIDYPGRVRDLESEVKKLNDEIEELKNNDENNKGKKKFIRLQKDYNDLEKDYDELVDENNRQKEEIVRLTNENEKLKENGKKKNVNDEIAKKYAESQDTVVSLKLKISELIKSAKFDIFNIVDTKNAVLFNMLIENDPSLCIERDMSGYNVFSRVSLCGTDEMFNTLIDNCGEYINYPNKNRTTPLIVLCDNDATERAKLLIQHGADPKIKDNYGMNAFLYSIRRSNVNLVKFLLENNLVDVNTCDNSKKNAYQYAEGTRNKEIISMLKGAGAKPPTIAKIYTKWF